MSIISIPISGLLLCLISPMTVREELVVVNSLNLDVFQQSVDRISKLSGQFASNHGVDYVVMTTGNEVYVSQYQKRFPHSAGKDEMRMKLPAATIPGLLP